MNSKENKLFLVGILLIISLIMSGYTIKNAEYMIIAEKYTKDYSVMYKNVLNANNVEDIDNIKQQMEERKNKFYEEMKNKYSSSTTDRLMLKMSYNKFLGKYDRLNKKIRNKKIELEPDKFSGGVSIDFTEEETIVAEKQVEQKEEKNPVSEKLPESLINAVIAKNPQEISNAFMIIKDEELSDFLVFTEEDEKSKINDISEIKEYSSYLNGLDYNDRTSVKKQDIVNIDDSSEIYAVEPGKDFSINKTDFIYDSGKYIVNNPELEIIEVDSLVIKIKNTGMGMYGKALIFDGQKFVNGVWLTDDNGKTEFFDNVGQDIKLYGKKIWMNICNEDELKI